MTIKNYYIVLGITSILFGCGKEKTSQLTVKSDNKIQIEKKKASPEEEVFYHVFQRSFYDSNQDNHGDLNGFTSKLDYLQDLGITSVLMTPLYPSIYYHNYFPDSFEGIDKEYGTLNDYISMIKNLHQRDMKFYMDMEIHYVTKNHTWFKESYKNPESEYGEYIIYNGANNSEPESIIFNLTSLEGFDGQSIEITTADLYNKNVQNYFNELFTFWLDPNQDGNFEDGVDGFRIDHMMDDLDWKGIRTDLFSKFWAPLFINLKAINPDIKFFGEQADWKDYGKEYFDTGKVDMMFGFGIREGIISFDKEEYIEKVNATGLATPIGKHQLVFLENHDIPRYASIVKGDPNKLKLGAFLMMFTKGIPSIYYGQEIGMIGAGGFGKYGNSDANDIPMREAFEWYATIAGSGMALWYKDTGLWWEQTSIIDNDGISVEEQVDDPNSLLNFYKKIIDIRKSNKVLQIGKQEFLKNDHGDVISFYRTHNNHVFLIIVNVGKKISEVRITTSQKNISKMEPLLEQGLLDHKIKEGIIVVKLKPLSYGMWKLQ
ncbi:alpha-amylase family glycosyl hydrolase [uncultured Aquimarina sp.]|uniref:alpha-amylase family glycosyl hydrolase n=1 Tax=uncultured Aquimarina sp. TaxID=575652 RepID=UPI00261294C9|nr:alpha-amylase family glycosyl hydrolase [uncultured Aquimarina sp.]